MQRTIVLFVFPKAIRAMHIGPRSIFCFRQELLSTTAKNADLDVKSPQSICHRGAKEHLPQNARTFIIAGD